MRKMIEGALFAAGMLGLSACSHADAGAAANAAAAGGADAAASGGRGDAGNASDPAAPGNAL